MHRRANSYSHSAGAPIFLRSNSCSSENSSSFVRGIGERRSTGRKVPTSINKGYTTIAVRPCVPASIKFAIGDELRSGEQTMSRPRSPPKSRNNGGNTDVQRLDQAFALIREQLLGLKTDSNQLRERLDSLTSGISKVELYQSQNKHRIVRDSPKTPLRRIQSVDKPVSAAPTIDDDVSLDLFDGPVIEMLENSDTASSSIPSIEGSPVISSHSHTLPRSRSPRRDSTTTDSGFSDITCTSPDSSITKLLVAPRRSFSVGRRGSGISLRSTPSPCNLLEDIKEGVSSKPRIPVSHQLTRARGSISSSRSQSPTSPDPTTPNNADTHSVIMRVSSATGQLEEFCTRPRSKSTYSTSSSSQHCMTLPSSSKQGYFMSSCSTLSLNYTEEGEKNIFKLSEEPQLVRCSSTLRSPKKLHKSHKRYSLIETTV